MIDLLESDVVGGKLDSTGRILAVHALMSTSDQALLQDFANSGALSRVEKWLGASHASARHDETQKLLALLEHIPISVSSLMHSGVGKTVNKVRKSDDSAVQLAAAELLRLWKALAENREVPPAVKRPAQGASEGEAKRVKPSAVVPTTNNDAAGLDAALAGLGAPKKASLRPEPTRPRAPTPPTSLGATPRGLTASAAAPSVVKSDPLSPINVDVVRPTPAHTSSPSHRLTPTDAASHPAPARKPPSFKRVSWKSADELVETREYIVEDKKGTTSSWGDLLQAERERERRAMQQRLANEIDPWAIGAAETADPAPLSAHAGEVQQTGCLEAPTASAAAQAPATPRIEPAIAWYTPAVLDEMFWPTMRGDESTEREAQQQRRRTRPELVYRRTQDLKGGPAPPPPHHERGLAPTVFPFDAPVEAPQAPPQDPPAVAPLLPSNFPTQQPEMVTGTTPARTPEVAGAEAVPMAGPQTGLSQQQLMMMRLGGLGGGITGGCMPGQPSGPMSPFGSLAGTGFGGSTGSVALGNGLSGSAGGVGLNSVSLGTIGPGGTGLGGTGLTSAAGGVGLGVAGGMGLMDKLLEQQKQQSANTGAALARGTGPGGRPAGFGQQRGDMAQHPKYKTKPCRYFASGGCKNGDGCSFLHDPNNLGTPADWGNYIPSKGGQQQPNGMIDYNRAGTGYGYGRG